MPGIQITTSLSIPFEALDISFIRASGPGGQNVNKVATAAQLRFNAAASRAIEPDMLDRLRRAAGRRMTAGGVIVITARRFRSQERNRQDAIDRLTGLLQSVVDNPVTRRATRPGRNAIERRLQTKQHRGRIKARRSAVRDDD
jgi:ribosome-associated protein